MFKRFFSKSKTKSGLTEDKIELKQDDKSSQLKEYGLISQQGENQLQQFTLPKLVNGMSDLVMQHQRGNKFEYVAVTHPNLESKTQVVNKLHASMPNYNKTPVDFGNLNPVKLINQTESIKVVDLTPSKKKLKKPYLLIDELIINFSPLTSFYSKFTDLVVCLHDDRYIEDTLVNVFVANSNDMNANRLSMDYCIPTENLDQISLSFTSLHPVLSRGMQWGAVEFKVYAYQLDFPVQTSIRDVQGILRLPDRATTRLSTNPRLLQMSINSADLEAIKIMKEQGDIHDFTEAKTISSRSAAYAGTQFQSKIDGSQDEVASSAAGFSKSNLRSDKRDEILDHLRRVAESSVEPPNPEILPEDSASIGAISETDSELSSNIRNSLRQARANSQSTKRKARFSSSHEQVELHAQ